MVFGISLHTTLENGPLSKKQLRLIGMLFRHMENASRIASLPVGIDETNPRIFLDRRGNIIASNEAAKPFLAKQKALLVVDGQLRAVRQSDRNMMDRIIRSALSAVTEGGPGGAARLQQKDGTLFLLRATPLTAGDHPLACFHPAVMVEILDPHAPVSENNVLFWREWFGFTPAESRLANTLITSDLNVREAAARLGVAYATARVQLASIFDKAGVRSQVQLARLLTRLGVFLAPTFAGLSAAMLPVAAAIA